ncbi:hypothetical protein [Mycobacterium sp. SMC-4]|uniref:hypothetical protein n=1 Tax=Mycobacterium sp. SMC-4 TaxID=2857059 RepID=UPI0021B4999E|nr:hypothetical protein [Mycobacterium sp. SMC-4]UXA20145.1 hypothetical protein KXD98_11520 [Mycobacterium sp. SMC-4]
MTPHSQRLSELFSSRLALPVDDDAASIVLGPRLHGLCRALGVPKRDWWTVSRLVDDLSDAQTVEALSSFIDVLVAERCRQPGDDLVSDLISYEADGRALTAGEIRAMVVAVLAF